MDNYDEKKGDMQMKNKKAIKVLQWAGVLLLAAVVLLGTVTAPMAEASKLEASHIEKLENVKVDYSKYLDSSVMQPLPQHIRDDETISVIVNLNMPTVMEAYGKSDKSQTLLQFTAGKQAQAVREQVAAKKAEILKTLDDQGVAYTTGENYDTLLCGFELLIKAGDFDVTAKSVGKGNGIMVGEVYNVAQTQLVENTVNVYETGIFKSGDSGYDGSGMVVAVLDTGLDSKHTAFSVENFTSRKLGLTYEDVAAVIGQTKANELAGGLSADQVYVNEKVPFGYDYADNDPDVYSTHNNHGTHVSGVIVGKDDTITGVAPNAQLVSMKVFSDIMDTARSSWILSALEDCVLLEVDVINMSLGTACGFSRESDEELTAGVYQKIREAGISLIVAASNSFSSAYGSEKNGNLGLTSNPDTGTVGSPGTYAGAMSVASINGEETPYIKYQDTIIYFDESNNGAAEENDFFETLLGDAQSRDYEYVIIPGVGRTADYTGMDVNGKIALVRRGDTTFEEKAMIAEKQGAAGIIIYNNVSGEIKMNVGDAKLAVCSISQNDGEMLVRAGGGKLSISKSQSSGPFISDFSSWGPGPNLEIKPEITAHGGNILSSVTGGGYDRLSGTSMACPNLAGVVILLRQYVVENFPDIANDNVKVNAMVNCLLMSTADVALNTNGLPYSVRKQGAGLANLLNSIHTPAYITTYDANGAAMDKTKLELGDNPEKTGVYKMSFSVQNFGSKKVTYELGAYVMTEGVSETKTNAGKTTVTEAAYLLEGAKFEVLTVNGKATDSKKLTVAAGESAKVDVSITLTEENKKYLDESFENGMYVEGYITLTAKSGTDISLNVPYLAFYGDWNVAPLFDLDYYETNADELDDSIPFEDKVLPDAYATRPIGGVSEDYVSYLGSYYFLQDPEDMIVAATRDYIALSNMEGTIHSLRFVWAGLLRNARKIEIKITDDITGEVIFETVDTDVRKSYGDGGSIYPANVEIEFNAEEYNLQNNTQYTVTLTGYLETEDGGIDTNKKNTFSFPLTADFQAPTVSGVTFEYEYDKSKKKNRLYALVDVYDNHYAMSAQLGYVGNSTDADGNTVPEMFAFEQYMTPIYSQRGATTTVKFELTDYIWQIKENAINDMTFAVTTYDYALNYATYEIGLPDDFVDFYFEEIAQEGLTLSPNEVFAMEPLVYPDTEWSELLNFTSSKPSVVRVVNNKIVAIASGNAIIKVSDPKTNKSVTFPVTVLQKGDDGFRRYDKPVADIFRLEGYTTQKAYYVVDSSEKEIGDTGDKRFFEGNFNLSMYPSETVLLNYDLDAYFPKDTTVSFSSSNDSIVKIDDYGNVTAVAEGFASVSVKVMMDGKSTYYSETVSVEVKDPYITTGASLTHYYGNGGMVVVPEDKHLTEIGNFAFANFEYIPKTQEELDFDDAETSKQWYIGESTITKVVLPEGIKKIGAYAFANLTGLEEIVLPSTLEAIEYGAFVGCKNLQKVTFSGENNLKIVNQHAFENCDLRETIDLSAVCVISNYAFAGNQKLKGIITGDSLLSVSDYAFAACKALETFTVTAPKVKYGPYAFTDCEALKEFYVNAAVLPEGMFYECKNLTKVTIGPDVNEIGEFAFRDTAITTLEVKEGNKAYKIQSGNHILSADGATLVAVAPTVTETYQNTTVTAVGNGAFSHNTKLTAVELPAVTTVGDYAFGSCENLLTVTLGQLTHIGEYAFFETAITQVPGFTAQTEIGRYAFAFTDITIVQIPDGMELAEGVFSECKSLQSVIIGNDVTVGKYAFAHNKDNIFTVENYNEVDEKYFYYSFQTALVELTIGNNVTLGESAFSNAHSLETVTLGENAVIGKMAFYNNASLKNIDLSKVKSVGDYAFSGDSYMICLDENMQVGAVSAEGTYMYTYHAPKLENVDLSAAESIGEYAFVYCHELQTVILSEQIKEIPQYAFADCRNLMSINLSSVTAVGDYAFSECGMLPEAVLMAVKTVGEGAFIYNGSMTKVVLNPEGCVIGNNAFAECGTLIDVTGLEKVTSIGDYAFLNAPLAVADLSSATHIGTYAFMKPELSPLQVILGDKLETMGDNPFAMCILEPFCITETRDFNGTTLEDKTYTFDISEMVTVIDGSLYRRLERGLELTTFVGLGDGQVTVAPDTRRISAMAFAGSNVEMVTMPSTTFAIGHKAFYRCNNLKVVVFGSQQAPILEEEFDRTWYENFQNMPATGDLGAYTDYAGNEVPIVGIGIVPYYMWNSTDGLYSNVYYGATFVNYVGHMEEKLMMIRPVNGQGYDSFVLQQYFDITLDGAQAADKHTLDTIWAIKQIPERVTYAQKDIVENARAMYNKIATLQQQALVTNYADLVSAEQRILSLTPQEEEVEPEPVVEEKQKNTAAAVLGWSLLSLVLLSLVAVPVYALIKSKKDKASFKETFVALCKRIGAELAVYGGIVATLAVAFWKWLVPAGKTLWKWTCIAAKWLWKYISVAAKWLWKYSSVACAAIAKLWRKLFQAKNTPEGEKPRRKRRKAAKRRKRVVIPEKLKKALTIVGIAAAAVLVVLILVLAIVNADKNQTPYEKNDAEGYSVSVKYDAGEGFFTTNTSVLVDAFSAEAGQIPLVAPEDPVREKNAFTPIRNGYFLAGWYRSRTANGVDSLGNTAYIYGDKWDFATDRLTVEDGKNYSASEPALTLYAAWVPLFEVQLYDLYSGELTETLRFDPTTMESIQMPAWDEESGAMDMHGLPGRKGYTFDGAYLDKLGGKKITDQLLTHPGTVNYENGTAENTQLQLYVKWIQGEWFHIYNAEQFVDNASVTGNYIIHNDLNFAEEKWPTSLMHGAFAGTIQANGHTFKNIKLTQSNKSKTYAGLFGQLTETAVITDLKLENVTFTIKGGTRVAGTAYGLLAGVVTDGAKLENVSIASSKLLIDSGCYFGTDDYTIGLVCGLGNTNIDFSGITCEATGDKPETVNISVSGSTVTVELAEE